MTRCGTSCGAPKAMLAESGLARSPSARFGLRKVYLTIATGSGRRRWGSAPGSPRSGRPRAARPAKPAPGARRTPPSARRAARRPGTGRERSVGSMSRTAELDHRTPHFAQRFGEGGDERLVEPANTTRSGPPRPERRPSRSTGSPPVAAALVGLFMVTSWKRAMLLDGLTFFCRELGRRRSR